MTDVNNSSFVGDNKPTELTVSALSGALKRTVEDTFSFVRVRGEISGYKQAASGHVYLDLKDENSVINSVCWKGVASTLSFQPMDGMEVIITGKITTYAPRSNYQLVISTMEIAGEGALLKILDERKKALQIEGLFKDDIKKPIPRLPSRIGVVTSPTGSVIRDILHRLEDRFPIPVYVYPCRVQGQGSASEVERGIDFFNRNVDGIEKVDIIIVARGGGSIEDLWTFNEECVARAVHRSAIPVISAIGHETDTTLIDYVSDWRSPTPTAAAEKAVPERANVKAYIDKQTTAMNTVLSRMIQERSLHLQTLEKSLPDVDSIMNMKAQRIDDLTMRMSNALNNGLLHVQSRLALTAQRLIKPNAYIENLQRQVTHQGSTLNIQASTLIKEKTARLVTLGGLLESYSFKKTLDRGFALVRDDLGTVVKDIKTAENLTTVRITFSDGDIDADIK